MALPVQTDPTAVFGRRVVAALLDAALIIVPVVMLATAQFEYKEAADLPVPAQQFCEDYTAQRGGVCLLVDLDDRVYFTDQGTGVASAVYWGATFGLLVLLQGLTGWTVGKLLTGIRTVGADGRAPGLGRALVRWVLWIADGFPYVLPLVGFIVGISTVGHRRIGDMVAKTFVVRASAAGSPIVVPGLTAPPPPVGAPGGWGAPPPLGGVTPAGWGQAIDPGAAGWAAPTPPAPPPEAPAPEPVAPAPQPAADVPHWDEARGTYIQWDPAQSRWMQWNEGTATWTPIPGQ